jgi:AcrR family transcriptional regulator
MGERESRGESVNNTEMEPAARGRLHEAILAELEEKGFERIELLAVLSKVGVPERLFESSYDSVEACIFAAYDELTARLDTAVREACREQGERSAWPERVSAGLGALLDELAARPQMACVLVRSFPSLGPKAQARSQAFLESFGPLLAGGREASEIGAELPSEVEMLATGAAEAILFEEVSSGRTAELPRLGPSILFSVLVPFLGPVAAATEIKKAQHRREQPGS